MRVENKPAGQVEAFIKAYTMSSVFFPEPQSADAHSLMNHLGLGNSQSMGFLKQKDPSFGRLAQVVSSVAGKVKCYVSSLRLPQANCKTRVCIHALPRTELCDHLKASEGRHLLKCGLFHHAQRFSNYRLNQHNNNNTRQPVPFTGHQCTAPPLFFLEKENQLANVCATLHIYKPGLASWERVGRCGRRAICPECSWAFDKCFW